PTVPPPLYPLSLHDALPISRSRDPPAALPPLEPRAVVARRLLGARAARRAGAAALPLGADGVRRRHLPRPDELARNLRDPVTGGALSELRARAHGQARHQDRRGVPAHVLQLPPRAAAGAAGTVGGRVGRAQRRKGHLVLGAQAGQARLAEVFRKAGFSHFRRAAETPFNLILEARR